jgi:hypothetical protein
MPFEVVCEWIIRRAAGRVPSPEELLARTVAVFVRGAGALADTVEDQELMQGRSPPIVTSTLRPPTPR